MTCLKQKQKKTNKQFCYFGIYREYWHLLSQFFKMASPLIPEKLSRNTFLMFFLKIAFKEHVSAKFRHVTPSPCSLLFYYFCSFILKKSPRKMNGTKTTIHKVLVCSRTFQTFLKLRLCSVICSSSIWKKLMKTSTVDLSLNKIY